jgi:hypothetical protein
MDSNGKAWLGKSIPAGEQRDLLLASSLDKEDTHSPVMQQYRSLPSTFSNRLSRNATFAYDVLQKQAFSFIAVVDKPLDPLPGPNAIDVINPKVYVAGLVPPIGGTP